MSNEVKSQTEGKEVAQATSDEELALLLAKSKELSAKENEGDGVKADYILLAKQGTKSLMKSQKELYIEGLSIGDFFLDPKGKKINLGATLKVVPLAFITLYQERDGTGRDASFFGVWNKEQATTYPLVEGNYFNRQLPNGHILVPVNWVMVEVLGHREIENAVIAYKSTGSRIWKDWKEDVKGRSSPSATLVYTIEEESRQNDNFEWTDIGFEYTENLLETNKEEAVYCLKKSNAIRESYEKHTLIGNHTTTNLSNSNVPQIEDNSKVEDSYDDEEVGF